MRKLLFLIASAAYAQTGVPIVDVATGLRCTAAFSPPTSATAVQVDCTKNAQAILSGAKMQLAVISGSTASFTLVLTIANGTGTDTIAMMFRRPVATGNLQIDTTVNGAAPVTLSIAVP